MWLAVSLSANISISIGIGFTVMFIFFSMQSMEFLGILFIVLSFALSMRYYQLALFPSSPSDSKVITTLSSFVSSFVYLFAILGAIITLAVGVTGLLPAFYYVMPVFWCVIVLIFAISQYSLAQIIQRAKWKTLNGIQQQIQTIQRDHPIPDKDARDALDWLLAYHDRVKATRNSALNLEAGFNLLNSLLLPVLAFLLGNLDKLIALIP